ncbi:MAG: TrkH family potassium uptake protein [Candidatus Thiodiazotropha taylori]|uniref:Trk system potassium uptake protein n=1 Tax=Candidatus Thiodiazotropha taylori TaxID=2792791 RepID=A0A9E4P6T5_9GAMM|nr:TrkH family potassium uptake protein [Candidatus Thiodiazotropha taylori]MCG7963837.1 TrkH family potassium uptake protein [Candidatus Thiodiazotropha endolucinida]RLW51690.1 MAG: potassium transporter [gamma proteobacterium symbiont of Stewartia floridana]MCG7896074.1 TrkH family potassium uptake protein [Candidatus Thiodiazotropha taylori]MCG7910237.1 TrkH family potassium uptake protein [Candidatus Thiodiazotropha taylori]
MHLFVVQRILGVLLMVFSLTMLPPLAISVWVDDGALIGFTDAFIVTLGLGVAFWAPVRNKHQDLRVRDGFLVVVMFWVVLGLTGSLPFMFAESFNMSLTNAVFESVSGLTTTGATVIVGIDELPMSILYYRQQLQWLGGMGIIVLAVAVLPMLGIGGMQLYRAETPGPVKDNKLTPRITETAKALWFIYLGLTLSCMLAYWLAGMEPFDALGHAFSTVAIGGFSTHDESIGYYDSTLIEMIAVVFMLLSGVNFALHFLAFRRRSLKTYFEDSEFRGYITTLSIVIILVSVSLFLMGVYGTWSESITRGIFQAVSIGTTTGFTTADYSLWPGFISILLLFSSFIGGCAGSTGGGIKVIRFLLLVKQGLREINRLIHPNAEIPIRVGSKTIPWRIVDAVWGFFALYVASFGVMYLALASTGLDLMTSFSAVAASINNLGPGLADVGAHYANLNDPAKWILCFAMLLGRLEIFTLLVLLTPAFWRK